MTGDGQLVALRDDGSIEWQLQGASTGDDRWVGVAVIGGDGTVYVNTAGDPTDAGNDTSHGIAAVSAKGTLLWEKRGVGWAAAVGADGTLYTVP
jgi:hypothetical protein